MEIVNGNWKIVNGKKRKKILKQNSNIFHWEITCFENHLSDIHTNPNKTLLIIVISRIDIFYSLIDTE